jgi:hypothetical protein
MEGGQDIAALGVFPKSGPLFVKPNALEVCPAVTIYDFQN